MCIDCGPEHECPCCGGEGIPLGVLGNRFWCRCRACGMEFNHVLETVNDDYQSVQGCDNQCEAE